VIKKVGFRYRQAEIAGIAVVEKLERTVGVASAVMWLRNAHVAEHFGVEKPTQKLQSFFSRWSMAITDAGCADTASAYTALAAFRGAMARRCRHGGADLVRPAAPDRAKMMPA
jgi:hypothetical protein